METRNKQKKWMVWNERGQKDKGKEIVEIGRKETKKRKGTQRLGGKGEKETIGKGKEGGKYGRKERKNEGMGRKEKREMGRQ